MITWRSYLSPITNWQKKRSKVHNNNQAKNYGRKKGTNTHDSWEKWLTHWVDTSSNKILNHEWNNHPPSTWLLPNVCLDTSWDIISDGWKNKHALPCAQHPAPVTISSTEGRYGIIKPWQHYHISLTKGVRSIIEQTSFVRFLKCFLFWIKEIQT